MPEKFTGYQLAAMLCSSPNIPSTPVNWGDRHRLGIDIMTLALSCGLTRVASYAITHASDTTDHQESIHGWQHDPGWTLNTDNWKIMVPWRTDKFVYLLNRLNTVKDENGLPLLDSSLVAWTGEYSYVSHSMLGHNLLLVGGANGKLDTGWHVDAGGAPVNRFHLTNMLAMGLSMSDIEKSGEPGFGEVRQLFNTGENQFTTALRYEADKSGTRYDNSKLDYFAQASQRRKPFPYLR